jgi:hypothetical protein
MRTLLRLSAVVYFLLLATPAAHSQSKVEGKAAEGAGPKLSFPEVKGWVLSAPRPLPPESGGYSVGYNSVDKVAVTVYVYNRGLARVPDDLSAKEVQRELAGAKAAVLEAKRLGLYKEVREEESGQSSLGGRKEGPKTLYARFRVQIGDQDNVSEIYVMPYRNHFIKLRVTRPATAPESVRASLDRLYAQLSKLLAK